MALGGSVHNRMSLAGSGLWLWLALAGSRHKVALGGFGWFWLALAGSGWFWVALGNST